MSILPSRARGISLDDCFLAERKDFGIEGIWVCFLQLFFQVNGSVFRLFFGSGSCEFVSCIDTAFFGVEPWWLHVRMLRDLKFLPRNSGKNEEIENVPVNSDYSSSSSIHGGLNSSRAPFSAVQEPAQNPKPENEVNTKGKIERTPTKLKGKYGDPALPLPTPDRHNFGMSARNIYGWAKNEPNLPANDSTSDDSMSEANNYYGRAGRGFGVGIVGLATPRTTRTVGRTNSNYSESYSTQSTPNKSVSKPPSVGYRCKIDGNGGGRWGNFAALHKGIPSSSNPPTVVDTVEVPHFDLKEDPSFWMEHNVQVCNRFYLLTAFLTCIH